MGVFRCGGVTKEIRFADVGALFVISELWAFDAEFNERLVCFFVLVIGVVHQAAAEPAVAPHDAHMDDAVIRASAKRYCAFDLLHRRFDAPFF